MISSKEAIGLIDHRTVIKRLAEIEYKNGFHGKEACAHALKKAEKQAIEALEKQIAKRPIMKATDMIQKASLSMIPGGVQTAVKPMRWIMTNMIIARTAGSE